MKNCPFCGTAWNGSKFCGECGKDLRQYSSEGSKTAPSRDEETLEKLNLEALPSGKFKLLGLKPEYEASVTDLRIPDSVEVIGSCAFLKDAGFGAYESGPRYLTNVVIGNGVRVIESWAFKGCDNLLSVTFGSALQFIGEYAFENCSVLPSVTIPQNVVKIEGKAFYNCKKLTDITIEKGVKLIGAQAFDADPGSPKKTIRNFSDAVCEPEAFPTNANVIGDSSAPSDEKPKKGFWQRFRR